MVEIIIKNTGDKLDVLEGKITYTKQVNDIGDLSLVNDSFSRSEKLPRTKKNQLIFESLGVVGSGSRTPYEKIKVQVLDGGVEIIPEGNLIITETLEDEYKYHIKEGAIDFYSLISDDTIEVLDLSDLNHIKTVSEIQQTQNINFQDYKYFIAWYGLPLLPNHNDKTNLPLKGMIPFIRFGKIIEAIENKYGWSFENVPDRIENRYLSARIDEIEEAELKVGEFNNFKNDNPVIGWNDIEFNDVQIDSGFLNSVGDSIIILESGLYSFEVYPNLFFTRKDIATIPTPISSRLEANGIYYDTTGSTTIEIFLNQGDNVKIQGQIPMGVDENIKIISQLGYLRIIRKQTEIIDFSVLLGKIKIKDFIKEILIQSSGTPFFNPEEKTITLKSLYQRTHAKAQDLSDYFVSRKSEKYTLGKFAHKNYFRLKYNEENADYQDGVLLIDNKNLSDNIDIYNSFAYARERSDAIFEFENNTLSVPYLKAFEIENAENATEIKYKPLKDRYFIADFIPTNERIYINGEDVINSNIVMPFDYREVAKTWGFEDTILNNSRVINVDLHLHQEDFKNIDLKKVVFLQQESAYFLISKITINQKTATAELIKINNYAEHRFSTIQTRQFPAD